MRLHSPAPGRPPGHNPAGAFSLIELLIVVAIISILAAIAVPNFIEAQTRAKVSRALADMRSLDTAFSAYRVDNNNWVVRSSTVPDPSLGITIPPSNSVYFPCYQNRLKQMSGVTTPIAYITEIPVDPFETRLPAPNNVLEYLDGEQTRLFVARATRVSADTLGERGFVLLSVGPDGFVGHIIALHGSTFCPEPYPFEDISTRLTYHIFYDPTNGTDSAGNIFRFNGWPNNPETLRDPLAP